MEDKQICNILRKIRKKIADENGIEFISEECNFYGNCSGTCPKCEEENKELQEILNKKIENGEKVNILGVATDSVENIRVKIFDDNAKNFIYDKENGAIIAGNEENYIKKPDCLEGKIIRR